MTNPRAISLWKIIFGVLAGIPAGILAWLIGQFNGATAQGAFTMDVQTFFALLAAISVGVNRLVEWIKQFILTPLQERFGFSDEVYVGITMVFAFLFSLAGCLYAGANFLSVLPIATNIPALVGIIISAGIVTGGSGAVHAVTELLDLLYMLMNARVERAENQAALLLPEPAPSSYKQIQRVQKVPVDMPEAG